MTEKHKQKFSSAWSFNQAQPSVGCIHPSLPKCDPGPQELFPLACAQKKVKLLTEAQKRDKLKGQLLYVS